MSGLISLSCTVYIAKNECMPITTGNASSRQIHHVS